MDFLYCGVKYDDHVDGMSFGSVPWIGLTHAFVIILQKKGMVNKDHV